MRAVAGLILVPVLAAAASASDRRIPFWPDEVPATLAAEIDGIAALDTVRALGRFHRVHGSPGFAAAAEYVRARAEAAGLSEARVERLPADGQTKYAHFRSYFGWTPEEASLEEIRPHAQVLARFPDLPVALADYSQDADVTAELVDVGAGTSAADYEGKQVTGRIVLASGGLPEVHRLACLERGAVGFLSDFPNQTTAFSGDDRDLVRWGHLSPYETKNRFAFMLSKRQSEALRARLRGGETIVLRARVKARMTPATYDVVSATIPGTDPSAGEIVLTAHLCHQSAGANDNASGSAAILEVGRALKAAIARGSLRPPRLSIRFLWMPEIAGAQAWLVRHPERAKGLVAGIHMDMVGGLLATTRGTFHLSRTAGVAAPRGQRDRPGLVRRRRGHVPALRRRGRRPAGGPGLAAGVPGGVPRRRARPRDGQRPRGLRGVELRRAHGLLPRLAGRHDPHQQGPAGEPRRDQARAGRLPGGGHRVDAGRAAGVGGGPSRSLTRAAAAKTTAEAELRAELAADAADGRLAREEAAAANAAVWRSLAALWPRAAKAARLAAETFSVRPASAARAGESRRSRARSQRRRAGAARGLLLRPPRGSPGPGAVHFSRGATERRGPRLRVPQLRRREAGPWPTSATCSPAATSPCR